MQKLLKEFEFTLNTGLEFANSGDQETTFSLILKAPGNIHSRWCSFLTKEFFSAAQSMSKNQNQSTASADEGVELDGPSIVLAIKIGGNMDAVYDKFKELITFCTPQKMGYVCMVAGSVPMTSALYDKLQLDDTDRLIGEYMKSFLIPSLG